MDFSTFGRRLSEIEAELEFGEFPDETGGVHVSEEIDAINAETFGDDLNPASTELEDYAAQTASLRLDDLEVVGTSTAPDASQIPIPAFDFGFGQPGPTLNQISDQLGSQLWSSSPSGLFNLWGDSNTPKNHQESVFDAAKGLQHHPAPIGGGGPFSVGEIGRPQAHPLGMDEVSSQSSVPVPQGPFTDLINSKLAPALFEQQPSPSMPPRLPESAISAEDLEMSLLASGSAQHSAEPAMQKTAPLVKADAHHHAHAPNQNQNQAPHFAPARGFSPFRRPGGPGPVQMPPAPTAPVMIPGLPPIPPMLMGIWMDVISGKGPLPHGVPPPPAPVVMFARQMMARGIGPPNDMMQRGPPRMMHNSQSEYMRRQATRKVAPGMPSGKTIEDFAFDPFRGFMSMKEREWLVKIQILQCQGTPLDDDFYYTVWREKQLMAGWTPTNKKMVNEADKRMLEEKMRERAERGRTPLKERDSNAEEPPKERKSFFAGALGRPVSSTVYNPRHLIDVRAETGDDESAKKSGTQKKLRTLLLRIESAAYLLIECSEYSRKVRDDPRLRDEALVEITSRVTLVMMELFSVEQITKTLQVGKGRTLFRKLISAPYPLDKGQLLSTLMRTVGSFKKGHDELTREIVPCIHFLLSTYSREQLLAFTSELEIDVLKTAVKEKNSVARDLICSVLVWCAQRKASSASPLFLWLRSADPIEWDGVGWSHCLSLWTSVIHFSYQDAQYLAEWLRLSVDPKAPSCAASLSISLLSSYS